MFHFLKYLSVDNYLTLKLTSTYIVHIKKLFPYHTNKELNDFFRGYKRTAQSAEQGFFGGIRLEKWRGSVGGALRHQQFGL